MSPKVQELINRVFPIAEDDHIELPNGPSLQDILKESLPMAFEDYARFRVDLCCGESTARYTEDEMRMAFDKGRNYGLLTARQPVNEMYRPFTDLIKELQSKDR